MRKGGGGEKNNLKPKIVQSNHRLRSLKTYIWFLPKMEKSIGSSISGQIGYKRVGRLIYPKTS